MPEKDDLEILYPEVELYGYKIRPWGLKQLAELSPYLYSLKEEIKKMDIDILKIFGLDETKGKKQKDDTNLMVEGLFDLSTTIAPYAAKIICVSSGMPQAEAEDLPVDRALVFLLTIIEQNINFLKNSLGLVTEKIESLRAQQVSSNA